MPKTLPTSLRLDPELTARLDAAAKRLGSSRAGVIKLCLTTFLDHFEANGGKASLPPDWKEIIQEIDGRTIASKMAASIDGMVEAQSTDHGSDRYIQNTSRRRPGIVHMIDNVDGTDEFQDKAKKNRPVPQPGSLEAEMEDLDRTMDELDDDMKKTFGDDEEFDVNITK